MGVDAASVRGELVARFDAHVERALARGVRRPPPRGWRPALPPAVRETLVGLARRTGACPVAFVEHYTARQPEELVHQLLVADDPGARLLWRPLALERLPRLAGALAGLVEALASAGVDPESFLGAPGPSALLAARPTAAELYAPTLFGGGAPLLGAHAAERDAMAAELAGGRDPDDVLDLRLSGNLVHELCHGPRRALDRPPPPWILVEAATIHLGRTARPAHLFPDVAGEAVPGVSAFVLLGDALARRLGPSALPRLAAGTPLAELVGARAAAVLEEAGWQALVRRTAPPFVVDALDARAWVKLVDLALAGHAPAGDDLLGAADARPWAELPWWHEEPTAADVALVEPAVRGLCLVNRLAPCFQTHPDDPPEGRVTLDVAACALSARPRPDGVFGEPATWLFPPSLARRLHERGVRTVALAGVTRARAAAASAALVERALAGSPGARHVELDASR